jgi:hypothetical protein
METDCLSVVVKLQRSEKDRSLFGPLIEEVKELLRSFSDHSVIKTHDVVPAMALLIS